MANASTPNLLCVTVIICDATPAPAIVIRPVRGVVRVFALVVETVIVIEPDKLVGVMFNQATSLVAVQGMFELIVTVLLAPLV